MFNGEIFIKLELMEFIKVNFIYKKKLFLKKRPYDSFISDNLDSWCSALTFTTENSSPLK